METQTDAIIYDLVMHPEAFMKIDREESLSELFRKISKSLNKGGMVTLQCDPRSIMSRLELQRESC